MMKDEHELELLIASRFPLIAIDTQEEERALQLLARCASRRQLPVFTWSITNGWKPLSTRVPILGTQEPPAALRHLSQVRSPGVYVLLDFHPYLSDPLHVRLLKEIAVDYERVPRTVVLMSHYVEVPPELDTLAVSFELSLPDEEGLREIFKDEVEAWQRRNLPRRVHGDRDAYETLLRHLHGLTEPDVRRLIREALEDDGLIDASDLPRLITQKHQIFSRESGLSFEFDSARFADVAGLKALKQWLDRRRVPFLDLGAAAELDVPKGIMLLGVQGCGKSLAAKAVAGAWGVPLMRLDFGSLFNKFLGETERNLRAALKAAESMAPCVLWIDEVEKGLASGGNDADNGESRRVLGTLLTWMAERTSRVFIVATSNDIESLPPELVRKGRLDEIFFVDLPGAAARQDIFRLHLKKRNQDSARFDLDHLVAETEGYSGAEIEQAVICSLYEARARGAPLDQPILDAEIARTRPLSVVMAERVAALRAWAADRTVQAD
jgi:hypothetical protein